MRLNPINTEVQTIWPIRIYQDPLDDIINDQKNIEGRVPDPRKERKHYDRISKDDIIHFILRKNGESKETEYAYRVVENRNYNSIEQMLESEDLSRILPSCESVEDGVEKYKSFGGYAKRAEEHGACAIEIGERVEVSWEFL